MQTEEFKKAIEEGDEEFLTEWGRGAKDATEEKPADENGNAAYLDGYTNAKTVMAGEQQQEPGGAANNRLRFSPHPLGGIGVELRGVDGVTASARLDIEQAAVNLVHLQALISMMFQMAYAQAAAGVQESGIVVPGRR